MFGDMPLPAKFLIAFVIVLALIGAVAWLVRRFGAGGLTTSSARGRQTRLGVIEATAVDSRRRLVLVRRDNVEHLIMLGGPTDVVVEANIVRAQAMTREGAAQRAPETPGWSPPVDAGPWPSVPEPPVRAGRGAERSTPFTDDLPLQPHPEPAPRVQAGERFPGLGTDGPRPGGRIEPPPPRAAGEPVKSPAEARRPFAAPPRVSEETHASEKHLAAMAQQLEAALRRPGATTPPRESAPVEPPARRLGGEPAREPRFSLMERALQSRTPFTSARAKAPPPTPAPEPPAAPAEASESEPSVPTPSSSTPEEAAPAPATSAVPPAETPTEEKTSPPVEATSGAPAEQPAEATELGEKNTASIEEEMANLLGRSPGKS